MVVGTDILSLSIPMTLVMLEEYCYVLSCELIRRTNICAS